ncbi:hypothetical protein KUL42_39400 [Alteromonas sp. KUL42]|uniref:DUF2513 domain-containing protein n=1 Tax=Alteromonas sp. KUL42 TaxID=2480797 RepID=UPI0010357076|nr:DUF2513 domain-containing protein [Alteromonas sp. KUL42]TAP31743.1 DUF2513 domain-containing protein [Alteromonas sp. KUL42]GEA09179.1 hypothetical protein KUL42_39400 [Alteromonas sp. KUL42]
MKNDIDYTANILKVFLDCDDAHVMFLDVIKTVCGEDIDEKFIHHYGLIVENGLVSRRDLSIQTLDKMGIRYSLDNSITVIDMPLRLTQKGHDYSKALSNKEVLSKLKDGFKDAPFKVLFDGSQQLLTHYFKKKIDALTSE